MSTTAAPDIVAKPRLDIGQVFRQGWRLFVKDIGPLLVATLIAFLLGAVTLGIMAGPLFAGLYGMVVARVRDGRSPEVGNVFSCLDRFWSYLGAALVLTILIGLAWLTIIGGILLTAIWLYVFPLMVDRGMGLGEAMRVSKDMVMERGFWEHVALVLIYTIVTAIIGWPFTLVATPFAIVAVTVAYYLCSDRADAVEKA